MKHTAGPWKLSGDTIYSDKQRTEFKSSTAIAVVWDYTDESLANAALIVEAPEMLNIILNANFALGTLRKLKASGAVNIPFSVEQIDSLILQCEKVLKNTGVMS